MNLNILIAIISLLGIVLHLLLSSAYPLFAVLVLGGLPLLFGLLKKAFKKEFGSDLIAGVAIVTSVLLAEYLAGTLVVLMLSGGAALENFAMLRASSVLRALAKRMPSIAHSKQGTEIKEIPLETVAVDDTLVVFPHEICPVDGIVIEGHGSMDESYLTGEPFQMTKTVGSVVISGSVNGESALSIRATHKAVDSRYAKITEVMRESEQKRPQMRRLGDKLGALYTPVALLIAGLAWYFTGDPLRFLSVMVVATPCPLLIGVPVAIIGSISLAASRGIIVKSPVALEQVSDCTVAIFDKTGTLTYGEPELVDIILSPRFSRDDVLSLVAGLERYSKHPLSRAILACAKKEKMTIPEATQVNEPPGQGLTGIVNGRNLQVTSRKKLLQQKFSEMEMLAPTRGGLECVILIDNLYAATFSFHDAPRRESKSFVSHLEPRHQFKRVMIVSGDRESEVKYLAEVVGIQEIYAQKSPEEKVEIVRAQTAMAKTIYVGDGINDAPAMMAATVGIGMGQNSEVTAEAAGVVIMDNSLTKVDEFFHISRRMKNIVLQSAIGGMLLSVVGMGFAATGYLSPVNGAIFQEIIDVLAILNALRAAFPPGIMSDL